MCQCVNQFKVARVVVIQAGVNNEAGQTDIGEGLKSSMIHLYQLKIISAFIFGGVVY